MPPPDAEYYISWCRWQGQDWYSLWWTAEEDDGLWADEAGQVPRYTSPAGVRQLADGLGVQLAPEEPLLQKMDDVFNWLSHPAKNPPTETLTVWNMFDDLSSGIGKPFLGNQKGTIRNRLFDKLYLNDGIIQLNQKGQMDFRGPHTHPWKPRWRRQELKVLRRILLQGFRLWERYTYVVPASTE
ncbi:hypothetical protein [Hymenobacter sp. 102]|uniref:hypothetical protein n=1 Tax=Hymenobacter sp. 102 TaxID=3403152 RepID=UPI003CF9F165